MFNSMTVPSAIVTFTSPASLPVADGAAAVPLHCIPIERNIVRTPGDLFRLFALRGQFPLFKQSKRRAHPVFRNDPARSGRTGPPLPGQGASDGVVSISARIRAGSSRAVCLVRTADRGQMPEPFAPAEGSSDAVSRRAGRNFLPRRTADKWPACTAGSTTNVACALLRRPEAACSRR